MNTSRQQILDEFFTRFVIPETVEDELWQLKRDVAAQLRQFLPAIVSQDGTAEQFQSIKTQMQSLLETVGISGPNDPPPFKTGYGDGSFYNSPEWFEDRNPFMGRSSPIAPPMILEESPTEIKGTVICSSLYEGPPGNLHGGVVAAILDQTLGRVSIAAQIPVMTGSLNITYLRPTPIEQKLELYAKTKSIDGKKVTIVGHIKHNGKITAEAEGIFINMAGKNLDKHFNSGLEV